MLNITIDFKGHIMQGKKVRIVGMKIVLYKLLMITLISSMYYIPSAFADSNANLLLKIYIDGIPLEFTSSMMPIKSWISPFVLAHIHLHSKSKIKYSDNIQSHKNKIRRVSKNGILGLLHSLKKK